MGIVYYKDCVIFIIVLEYLFFFIISREFLLYDLVENIFNFLVLIFYVDMISFLEGFFLEYN